MSVAMPELDERTETWSQVAPDTPWNVVLHNDDINTVEYVILTLMDVLQKDKETCTNYTLEVDKNGQAVVFTGKKEEAQRIAAELKSASLQATVEQNN